MLDRSCFQFSFRIGFRRSTGIGTVSLLFLRKTVLDAPRREKPNTQVRDDGSPAARQRRGNANVVGLKQGRSYGHDRSNPQRRTKKEIEQKRRQFSNVESTRR